MFGVIYTREERFGKEQLHKANNACPCLMQQGLLGDDVNTQVEEKNTKKKKKKKESQSKRIYSFDSQQIDYCIFNTRRMGRKIWSTLKPRI